MNNPTPTARLRPLSWLAAGAAILLSGAGIVQAYSTFCGTHSNATSTYHINPNFTDGSAGSAQQQIGALTRAANEWNDEGGSQFQWVYSGQSSANSISTGDGHNVIYSDPGNGGSTLAETWCSSSGGNIRGWDMRFYDGDHTWSISPSSGQFDLEGVAVHELGHALGLGHSTDGSATMFPSTSSGQASMQLRSIENDDKAGVQFLYGASLNPPDLMTIQPTQGYVRGGQTVTLTGTNFTNNSNVFFGPTSAAVLSRTGDTEITVRAPKGQAIGLEDVRVQHSGGSDTLTNAFDYQTNPNEVSIVGSPRINRKVDVVVYGPPNADYAVIVTSTVGPSRIKGIDVCFRRDGNLTVLGKSFGGRAPVTVPLDSTGELTLSYTLPNDQALVFQTLYVQGVIDRDPSPSIRDFVATNCAVATIFP